MTYISIVVPCRNAQASIAETLRSVLAQRSLPSFEVALVDGRSTDNTRSIITEVMSSLKPGQWPKGLRRVVLLDNPGVTAPNALNTGISLTKGELVVRVDAHSQIEENYVSTVSRTLTQTRACCVGGALVTVPGDSSNMARAIAEVMSHPIGVGGGNFRIQSKGLRHVDTVAFGVYRREDVVRAGPYRPDLAKNQDDEFNARLSNLTGRPILQDPNARAIYRARTRLSDLARQYYFYGKYKLPALRFAGARPRLRHVVPSMTILLLATSILAAPLKPFLLLTLPLYFAAVFLVLLPTSTPLPALSTVAAVTMHMSYGLGFVRGLVQKPTDVPVQLANDPVLTTWMAPDEP